MRAHGDQPALALDGFFALHPSMPNFQRMYRTGQGAVVHASATAYRDRSHLDGQDVLESGFPTPGHFETGWLNRLLDGIPAGDTMAPGAAERVRGFSVGANAPLVIRGKAPVLGWAPSILKPADSNLIPRLGDLYGQRDPMLASLLQEGIETGKIASGLNIKARGGPGDPNGMEQMARGAARLIAHPEGPRIATPAFEGWDTHAQEIDRLAKLLNGFTMHLLPSSRNSVLSGTTRPFSLRPNSGEPPASMERMERTAAPGQRPSWPAERSVAGV